MQRRNRPILRKPISASTPGRTLHPQRSLLPIPPTSPPPLPIDDPHAATAGFRSDLRSSTPFPQRGDQADRLTPCWPRTTATSPPPEVCSAVGTPSPSNRPEPPDSPPPQRLGAAIFSINVLQCAAPATAVALLPPCCHFALRPGIPGRPVSPYPTPSALRCKSLPGGEVNFSTQNAPVYDITTATRASVRQPAFTSPSLNVLPGNPQSTNASYHQPQHRHLAPSSPNGAASSSPTGASAGATILGSPPSSGSGSNPRLRHHPQATPQHPPATRPPPNR